MLTQKNLIKQKTNQQLSINLERLKNTQEQLVEHEKLASLGQLTAGIAHEIQNPLNFVINFSELNTELIDDLKNIKNEKERNDIVYVFKENINKIKHHGKRADDIVKGMMMHSHGTAGEKQLTDIYALCEEALKNSYHAMRARYPGFSVEIEKRFATNADGSVPKQKVSQQDISRVLLNLVNNAFYAVHEKSLKSSDYQPEVSLIT